MPNSDAGHPRSNATAHIASLLARGPRPPGFDGCYSRTPPPSIGKWAGRIGTYGCRAPTARRRPPRPESIRARCRQTLVGRGRGSALSPSSPGAQGASGSRRDRAAWRPGAAGPHDARTPDASRRPSARRTNRSPPLCLRCALRACDQRRRQGRGLGRHATVRDHALAPVGARSQHAATAARGPAGVRVWQIASGGRRRPARGARRRGGWCCLCSEHPVRFPFSQEIPGSSPTQFPCDEITENRAQRRRSLEVRRDPPRR